MKYKVASFDEIKNHPQAVLHNTSEREQQELIYVREKFLRDTSREVLELRDAILVPGGGIVWNEFWIDAYEISYYPKHWASEEWRPGDLDLLDNTIEIPEFKLIPSKIIEETALFCDSGTASSNFGHFVHDFLPYGKIFRELKSSFPSIIPIISRMKWQSQAELMSAVFEINQESFADIEWCTLVKHCFVARRQSLLEGDSQTTSFFGLREARDLALTYFGQ